MLQFQKPRPLCYIILVMSKYCYPVPFVFSTPCNTLAPCPWTCSFGWCLAEGYGHGGQRRPIGPCGSGRTSFSFLFPLSEQRHKVSFVVYALGLLTFSAYDIDDFLIDI